MVAEHRRKWWWLCKVGEAKSTSLDEFLEVEQLSDNSVFYGAVAKLEGMMMDSPRVLQSRPRTFSFPICFSLTLIW
ncbi:uncharacterized protein HKW66_Vig0153670 [Vigna angularis]|uniref:Uncharacterized protein n=1 Tax=Phaseolus angularis TaxID=3914 RepID=A0A8T0JLX9_PHAAN|nr:uncharacterized protein HKW66_Vig0153670 [Vigna angularis]